MRTEGRIVGVNIIGITTIRREVSDTRISEGDNFSWLVNKNKIGRNSNRRAKSITFLFVGVNSSRRSRARSSGSLRFGGEGGFERNR